MKLFVDANLSVAIVDGLHESGYDAIHVGAVGLLAASDAEIFDFAAENDLALVASTASAPF